MEAFLTYLVTQRYVKRAVLAAGIAKPTSPHTLRHSYWDTDDFTHVLNKGGKAVVSPLDNL